MTKARIGFIGVGWIGRHRMAAMLETGAIEAVGIADPSAECRAEAGSLAPHAIMVDTLDDLLALGLDGVVIATPSAAHAAESIHALEQGCAVFCQKPLGRTAGEVEAVLQAARKADRLLGVDLSYRHTEAASAIAAAIGERRIGEIRAIDLTFHNAYGPGKPWFYDRALSGGGCLIDLGVHLIDLAMWLLDFPVVSNVQASLRAGGERWRAEGPVEDYAVATCDLGGIPTRIACSWRLHAGRDAVIEASFYGSEGGLALRNVGGSFYDFEALAYCETRASTLVSPPDDWGGRAAAAWAARLKYNRSYDAAAGRMFDVSAVIDNIYQAALHDNGMSDGNLNFKRGGTLEHVVA